MPSDTEPILQPRRHQNLLTQPVTIGKILLLILGVIVLTMGLHSHLQSSWVKKGKVNTGTQPVTVEINIYKICHVLHEQYLKSGDKCPDIAFERYFVGVIIACFILTLTEFTAERMFFIVNLSSRAWKCADVIFHLSSAILLMTAAALYITSALQIKDLFEPPLPTENGFDNSANSTDFRSTEKILAGILTIIQSLLYGVVAVHIAKS